MLNMTLQRMCVLSLYQINLKHWITTFQECKKCLLVMNDVDGLVGEKSCCCFCISYYLSEELFCFFNQKNNFVICGINLSHM